MLFLFQLFGTIPLPSTTSTPIIDMHNAARMKIGTGDPFSLGDALRQVTLKTDRREAGHTCKWDSLGSGSRMRSWVCDCL